MVDEILAWNFSVGEPSFLLLADGTQNSQPGSENVTSDISRMNLVPCSFQGTFMLKAWPRLGRWK